MVRVPRGHRLFIGAAAVIVAGVVTAVAVNASGPSDPATRWVGSWEAAMHEPAVAGLSHDGFSNQTVRMTVHLSAGGDAVRIRLSNEFGTQPLTIGEATIGTPPAGTAAPSGSPGGTGSPGGVGAGKVAALHAVAFSGRATVVIPTGGEILSDSIPMTVPAMSDLTVSLWLPLPTGPTTFHTVSRATSYVGKGDRAEDMSDAAYSPISVDNPVPGKTDSPWFFLTGIDVRNNSASGAVVVFGDSISDGFTSGLDANKRWPDLLAQRLATLPAGRHAPAVLNASLSGDALGHQSVKIPQVGPAALSRFDSDVLGQTGARVVIVELGINDLLLWGDHADAIVGELRQVAVAAHEARLTVLVCTLSPFGLPAAEGERQAVNQYIRATDDFDGMIDMDKVLRDPHDATKLRADLDSGDHVHPTAAGYQLIANAIPLDLIAP